LISVSDNGYHVRREDIAEFAQVCAVCLDAGCKHLAALERPAPARFTLWAKIMKDPDGD